MKRDFERLANQRLWKLVEDVISLYEMGDLDPRDAALGILSALLLTTTKVIAWAELNPSRDDLYLLIDSLLRSARKIKEQQGSPRRNLV
jgi:hypothetical protein